MNAVVVSGLGVTSPSGLDLEAFWANLAAGRPSFTPARALPDSGVIAAEIDEATDFSGLPIPVPGACDRNAVLAVSAAGRALADAGLVPGSVAPERIAVILGNGGGGLTSLDAQYERLFVENKRPHPFSVVRAMGSSSASWVSIACGAQGPCFVIASACASATHAIGVAAQLVRSGVVDVAITGGTEAPLSRGTLLAWNGMKIMSRTGCRPFSRDRDGLVVGEGAGILVLEREAHARARGRKPTVAVAGFGSGADAGDIVAPTVEGMARAMRAALTDADLAARDIAYVNAHGTGTRANDLTEVRALREVFGPGAVPPVSSTKGTTGHALGAAGALEAVATVLAMTRSVAPPTANLTDQDPELDIDAIPLLARPMPIRAAMSNSFAFGGLNASLILRQVS
ncbi:beta-ketoacyl-[acyl-carrier-protein] synthase family protein [Methylobacterium sp. WL9]|uniref:beta-ketoacyl-[acyl-carrier-protein] synthase family protein n=1 Tax=Methylobacterium sp. WL9 TaxID=2603898 RepID=UPI0011CC642F|nr:beta-ketoacyl-[acyl-carrier-protein] synthase family protein [Methylobacterium sp. WL9]TXN21725.1 beta-ketoacyl-[acyl-carrier-protein] synthase family protein [Methylobacterium sp. WL9]